MIEISEKAVYCSITAIVYTVFLLSFCVWTLKSEVKELKRTNRVQKTLIGRWCDRPTKGDIPKPPPPPENETTTKGLKPQGMTGNDLILHIAVCGDRDTPVCLYAGETNYVVNEVSDMGAPFLELKEVEA